MDSIAEIILKHDGYIWGEYVWSKIRGEQSKSIKCRFVSTSLFDITAGSFQVPPKHFLIDLNHKFTIKSIRKNVITLMDGVTIDVFTHSAVDELEFMRSVDFTCNLLDYRRDGYLVRESTSSIQYEVSPYETVIQHIKKKKLVIVNAKSALQTAEEYVNRGWNADDDIFISSSIDMCSICHDQLDTRVCFKTPCGHVHHTNCMNKWFTKNTTCPLCRENL